MSSFTTKSRTIELLGKKQIRDGVTALTELIKNAYDADASTCRVIFDSINGNNYFVIADDGCGMTLSDIQNKWLVIGTDSKYQIKRVTPLGRVMMGEKGIGRLASASLGNQLLLLTKSSNNSGWVCLFVDWNTFNNKNATLDQIEVGVSDKFYIQSTDDIIDHISDLVLKVHSNLEKDCWQKNISHGSEIIDLYDTINSELENYYIDAKRLMNQIKLIDRNGHGTILYITNVIDDWGRILDTSESRKDKQNNSYLNENYSRLNSFIFNMNNSIQKFDIMVWCFGEIREFSYGFTEEDYKKYDLKVSGTISKGKFFGQMDVINADPGLLEQANSILRRGISVEPLQIDSYIDCGDFKIEFIHIEGSKMASSLTDDTWAEQAEKLKQFGGISIYRDNVRILPYGEFRNDFLGIEERRTRGAGYYVFSHRRMYGRIDITRKDNPLLEDKSSREGLIENRAYFYFENTLTNLLTYLAVDIINGLGIKNSYTSYNEKIKKEAELNLKIAKERDKQNKAYIKTIKVLIESAEKVLKENTASSVIDNVKKALPSVNGLNTIDADKYLSELKVQILRAKSEIRQLQASSIVIDDKFSAIIDNELSLAVYGINDKIKKLATLNNKRIRDIQRKIDDLSKIVNKKIAESKIHNFESLLSNRIGKITNVLQKEIRSKNNDCSELTLISSIIDKQQDLKETMTNEFGLIEKSTRDSLTEKLICLNNLKAELNNDLLADSYESMSLKISEIEEEIQNIIDAKYHQVENFKKKYEYVQTLMSLYTTDISVGDYLNGIIATNNSLQNENNILAELANVGLAAEVVDHEFNQYFSNVNYAISNITKMLSDDSQRYWMRQISEGFKAISFRHSQLSPTYRSKNQWKRNLSVFSLIDAITDFYQTKLRKSGIKVNNLIRRDIYIYTSPSKIQPVLSNLMDNAIYWLQNAEKKEVYWYFDDESMALYIEDTGPGIPDYLNERVFQLFFSTKPNSSGRGIGLYLTRKILVNEGHEISLVKGKYGTGACFKITFKGVADNV